MNIFYMFISFITVISFFSLIIWSIYSIYLKISKKTLSNFQKNWGWISLGLFVITDAGILWNMFPVLHYLAYIALIIVIYFLYLKIAKEKILSISQKKIGFIILGFFAVISLPISTGQFWTYISLITVIYFLYVKIGRKPVLSNSQKKLGFIILGFFAVIFLLISVAQDVTRATKSHESQTKSKKQKDTYKLYPVTNIKTSYDSENEDDQVITGQTSAPDGSVIFMSLKDTSKDNYAMDDSVGLAKVKDGQFKAYISVLDILNDKPKSGAKVNLKIVAVGNYNSTNSIYSDLTLTTHQLKGVSTTEITVSDQAIDYYNSLDDEEGSESSSIQISADDSASELKTIVSSPMAKDQFLTIEKGLLDAAEYNDIDAYNESQANEFKVRLDNINSIINQNDLDKSDYQYMTSSDIAILKDYHKKLIAYLNSLHDYASTYQVDNPSIQHPGTSSEVKADLQAEIDEFNQKFLAAKNDWINAYDNIMNN